MAAYTGTVAQLLTYGSCSNHKDWPDYPAQLGLTLVDVPELLRMALDPQFDELDSDRLEIWAPLHAMRALGQLRAEEAIAPLIELFSIDDDWLREEIPDVFAMFGAPAIDPLVAFLKNEEQDEWARVSAIDALGAIGMKNPECRDDCVHALVEQLQLYSQNGEIINSSLVFNLTDLKATEAAALIEEVFTTVELDEFLTGSWPMVQVALGLKQESDFSSQELTPKMPPQIQQIQNMLALMEGRINHQPKGFGHPTPPSPNAKKKKNKKKKK